MSERPLEEEDGGDEDGDGGGCGGRASPASSFDAFHLLLLISPLSLSLSRSPSVTLPPSPISVTMVEDKFCPPFPSNFAA